uniref:Saposin B-type domain-containing protein n=1 Tax=Caenorhabditis tropicalis TaxID=1561998 RepID=A0A1I7V2Y2_9PELO
MKCLIIFCLLATSIVANDLEEAQGQFCTMCNKNWEEKVPKNWAEVTAYLVIYGLVTLKNQLIPEPCLFPTPLYSQT